MFDVDKMYIMYPEFDVIEYDKKGAKEYFKKYGNEPSYGMSEFKSFDQWFDSLKEEDKEVYLLKDKNGNNAPIIKKKQVKIPDISIQENGNIEDDEFEKIIDSLMPEAELTKFKENELKGKRNNLIIDMMRSILTHENTASKILNPGGFNAQKRAARIVTILQLAGKLVIEAAANAGYNIDGKVEIYLYLNTFTDELLEDIAKKYAPKMDITASITQVILHLANTIAGRLIGIFANHNAHHAIMQQTELSISPSFGFKLNGKWAQSLNNILAFDGSNISRNMSGFLAASVDAVKDPVLKFLNLNDFTADICGLLTRAGYTPDTVGLFLNQPIILDITKAYFKLGKQGLSKKAIIENVIRDYNDGMLEELDANIPFFNSDLARNIALGKESDSYMLSLIGLLLLKMQAPSTALADAVAASRADTSGGGTGPTHADTINKLNRTSDYLEDLRKENPVLTGGFFINENIDTTQSKFDLYKKLLSTTLPINQSFFTLGLEATKKTMSKYFPHFKPEFMWIVDKLRSYTTYNKIDEKTMNSVFSDLFAYILTLNKEFGNGNPESIIAEADEFINDFPLQYELILKDNPEFNTNLFIKYISPTIEAGVNTLKFREVGKLQALQRDNIMSAWESLLYSNAVGKELAIKLFKYAYYRNGFSFGPSSWMHLAPVEVKKNIPNYIEDLNKILDKVNNKRVYEDFVGLYLINHSDNRKLVPLLTDENIDIVYLDENNQPLPFITVTVTEESPKDNVKALVKKGKEKVDINGAIVEVPWNSWKPVISFLLQNGSTVLYAANLAEDIHTGELKAGELVQYVKIEKAAQEKLFLHYVYDKDFRTFDNVLRTPAIQEELNQEVPEYTSDLIPPDTSYGLDSGTIFASISGINNDDLQTNGEFNPNKNKELYNDDGTKVCNAFNK